MNFERNNMQREIKNEIKWSIASQNESCKNKQVYFYGDKNAFLEKEHVYLDFR